MIKTKKQMFIVIGVFTLVMLLGTVTYAFFNYTRTGVANTIRTGNINFESSQGTPINLTNMFPIDPTETGVMNDATKVGTVTINVTGNTSYDEGIEYLVSAVNVTNSVGSGANAKSLPISINVSVASNTNNDPATTLGTSDTEYFTNRGGSDSIYKVLAEDTISDDQQILVGYIAPDEDEGAVDGNIVIKTYIDKTKVAITDTYPEETIREVIATGYSSSACEIALTGVTNASTYCASAASLQEAIDGETLTTAQITLLVNAGIVNEYTNGTTSNWVGTRETFTTDEWNALQQNGISFQIKVEANEGTWVEAPIVYTDTSCFTISGSTITGYDPVCGGTDVVIPKEIDGNKMITIGSNSFTSRNLTSIYIPDSITTISDYAFAGNRLISVIIPKNVNSIGTYSFAGNRIEYMEISNANTILGNYLLNLNGGSGCYLKINVRNIRGFNGGRITKLELGEDVEVIDNQAFLNNSITELVIPNGVTEIGQQAFQGNLITKLELPNSVTTIRSNAFNGNQLNELKLSNNILVIEGTSFAANSLTSVVMPSSITSWKCNAFDSGVTIINQSNVLCSN